MQPPLGNRYSRGLKNNKIVSFFLRFGLNKCVRNNAELIVKNEVIARQVSGTV